MGRGVGGGVHLYSKYKVNWGSYQHISAVLLLMKEAIKREDCDYFHIISSNSFITRPMSEVVSFFETNSDTNYIQMDDLDKIDVDRVIDPWFIYYHFLHLYDKKTSFGNNFDYYFLKVQSRLGIKRKIRYKYHGLLYSHLTREFVDYALKYIKENPAYFRNLKTCNISEEFFFHNLIMNSPFKEKVCNSSLFFNKWTPGGVAEFLTDEDYSDLMEGNYFFARKFGKGSEELFQHICRTIGVEKDEQNSLE